VALGWSSLGRIHRRQGDIGSALTAYATALKLAPEHPQTHQNLAVAQLLGGNIDAARASFRQAIDLFRQQGHNGEADQLQQQAGAMVRLED
jgi:Flp pilus assembly protein TadD